LRPSDAALSDSIFWRAIGQRKAWIAYLNQQLKAVGLERDVTKMQSQLLDLRDLNLRLGEYGFEYYRWPKRRASG
jgi:hypothetical protein